MPEQVLQAASELSTELLDAIAEANAFLALDRGFRGEHAWMNRCCVHRNVTNFLAAKPLSQSRFARVELGTIVAQAYSECGDSALNHFSYPSAAEAKSLKARADGLAQAIAGYRWLPAEATTGHFQSGLEALRKVYPCKRVKGENNKGDPRRRAFILRLAEKFYRSFHRIPVSAISDLTSMGWPDINERAVRLVLSVERRGEIAAQVDASIKLDGRSNTLAMAAINKLTRRGLLDTGEVAQQTRIQAQSDDATFRMIIAQLGQLNDADVSSAAINALSIVADDFGVMIRLPIDDGGSETMDF